MNSCDIPAAEGFSFGCRPSRSWIDKDWVLSLLRNFGLMHSGASFPNRSGLEEYKRRWILAAVGISRKERECRDRRCGA